MKVKVWNKNPHVDWKEKFKGDDVIIPKGKFIEMEFYEAHEFKGQFSPIKILADGTQDPASFKMIYVEPATQEQRDELEEDQEVFQCNLCKKAYMSEAALLKHSETHSDHVVSDPEAEKAMPKKRGRPPKVEVTETA